MDQYTNSAVCIKNASKFYGKKSVLQNLDMHVEKGIIYGLLGSSGCGKTTLLKCIVGRKNLDFGTIWVLGGSPGSTQSGVPGPRVGYMPQETALLAEFTVKAAIYYFGKLSLMNSDNIKIKFKELTCLLELPPGDRRISDCSGGQQRRVSFAVALVSNPELLVLDEPTVGLDPLLRESIWDYLLKLTNSRMVSVIITTHYIEEARGAHKVGLMSHGRLLVETSPENLLCRYGTNSLEDVFLILSKKAIQGKSAVLDTNIPDSNSISSTAVFSEHGNFQDVLEFVDNTTPSKLYSTANTYDINLYRIKALLGKSWLQISKNYSGALFMFAFPIVQIVVFFLAIGDDVKNIKVAVHNHEDAFGICSSHLQNNSAVFAEDTNCRFQQLGCHLLKQLNDSMIDTVFYDDIHKAKDAILHGEATGALYIPKNFSRSLQGRLLHSDKDDVTLEYSQLQAWVDMSNYQIGGVLKYKLINKMLTFLTTLFADCNIPSRFATIPINFKQSMYGNLNDSLTTSVVAHVVVTTVYFLGASNSVTVMITDKLEGIWERSIVAGVSVLELFTVFFLTQFGLIVIQSAITLAVAILIYRTECIGSLVAVAILTFASGISGISFGFFVSCISNTILEAYIFGMGVYFPLILLNGSMWPLEASPKVLQWFALCLPITLPGTALRNVMRKGWSIFHKDVINGLVANIIWITVLSVISLLIIKSKR